MGSLVDRLCEDPRDEGGRHQRPKADLAAAFRWAALVLEDHSENGAGATRLCAGQVEGNRDDLKRFAF